MATTQASPTDPNSSSTTATSVARRHKPGRAAGRPQVPAKPAATKAAAVKTAALKPAAPVRTVPAQPEPAVVRPTLARIIDEQEEIFVRRQP